jgi:hypothetical protein
MFKIINSKMWLFAVIIAVSMIGCGSGDDIEDSFGNTGSVCQGADCVSIGSNGDSQAAAGYVILAKSGVDTIPTSAITGNVGLSPAARVFLTGFSLIGEPTDTYYRSVQVVDPYRLYAADLVGGTTSADLTPAVLVMQAAYTDAAGRPAGVGPNLDMNGGTLIGDTLTVGTYTWGSAVHITGDITISGSSSDVVILQISGNLLMDANKSILLSGGIQPQNIFWQVAGNVEVLAGAHFEGIILCQTDITFRNLSSINGRLYAQTAVNLDATTVTQP